MKELDGKVKKILIYSIIGISLGLSLVLGVYILRVQDDIGRDVHDTVYDTLVFYPRDYVVSTLESNDFTKEDVSNLITAYKFTRSRAGGSNEFFILDKYLFLTFDKLRNLYDLMSIENNNVEEIERLTNEIIDLQEKNIAIYDKLNESISKDDNFKYIRWYKNSNNDELVKLLENYFNENTYQVNTASLDISTNEVKVDSELNKFVSKFVYMNDFNVDSEDKGELISFAVYNNLKDNFSKFEVLNDEFLLSIDEEHIEETIKEYFGIENFVDHQSVKIHDVEYRDGSYYIPMADGEAVLYGQVSKVEKLDNELVLDVDIYTEDGYVHDIYTPIGGWTQEEKDSVSLVGRIALTVKEIREEAGSRYIVLKIKEVPIN